MVEFGLLDVVEFLFHNVFCFLFAFNCWKKTSVSLIETSWWIFRHCLCMTYLCTQPEEVVQFIGVAIDVPDLFLYLLPLVLRRHWGDMTGEVYKVWNDGWVATGSAQFQFGVVSVKGETGRGTFHLLGSLLYVQYLSDE